MKKDRRARKKEIALLLRKALLNGGEMSQALYEYELGEHLDYWYRILILEKSAFVFVLTENRGDIAMVLVMPDKTAYVNEKGRAKLAELWPQTYDKNLTKLIPGMADDLADNMPAFNSVTIMPDA